jgi:hypothetical protein
LNMFEYVWICLNMFEYVWICIIFEYFWIFLNIYFVLMLFNVVLCCFDFFECSVVWICLNMFEYVWMLFECCLNVVWMLFEYVWICLNMFEYVWMLFLAHFMFASLILHCTLQTSGPGPTKYLQTLDLGLVFPRPLAPKRVSQNNVHNANSANSETTFLLFVHICFFRNPRGNFWRFWRPLDLLAFFLQAVPEHRCQNVCCAMQIYTISAADQSWQLLHGVHQCNPPQIVLDSVTVCHTSFMLQFYVLRRGTQMILNAHSWETPYCAHTYTCLK